MIKVKEIKDEEIKHTTHMQHTERNATYTGEHSDYTKLFGLRSSTVLVLVGVTGLMVP